MPASLRVMAADLGASNGRCILGEYDGSRVTFRQIRRFGIAPVRIGESLYWNPLQFLDEIKSAVAGCVKVGLPPDTISIDSWAQDFGLITRNGTLLGLPHCYRDPYTAGSYRMLEKRIGMERIFGSCGVVPFPGSTLPQLVAQTTREPWIADCADSLLFIPNLLYYFMSGVVSCDYTLASFTSLYDNFARRWHGGLIGGLGLPAIFPEAKEPGQVIAETDESFSAEAGCRMKIVLGAGHDTLSAFFASPGSMDRDTIVISSGTWSMLLGAVEKPLTEYNPAQPFYNTLGPDGRPVLCRGVTGLWILQQCMKQWRAEDPSLTYESLARKAASFEADAWFDADSPELSLSADMCATVRRLCEENGSGSVKNRQEIYLSILNSLARKYAQVVGDFERVTGAHIEKIRVVGGGARNPVLTALTEKHTGRQVLTGPFEATSIGNILCQLIALGEIRRTDIPQLIPDIEEEGSPL